MIVKVLYLILAHMLGDYFLQSDYLSKFKGSDDYVLIVHCSLYVVPFIIIFGVTWHLIPLFLIHVVIDRLKARHNKLTLWQDQLIHYVTALIYFL